MTSTTQIAYGHVIDADGHIHEPPDLWDTYLEPQYRHRALRVRPRPNGTEHVEIDGRWSKFFHGEFLARGGIVSGDAVAADHEDFLAPIVGERDGRAEGFERFRDGVRRADVFPQILTRLRINREQVGVIVWIAATVHRHVALKNLEVKSAVGERGAGGVGPLIGKRPVVLLDVA